MYWICPTFSKARNSLSNPCGRMAGISFATGSQLPGLATYQSKLNFRRKRATFEGMVVDKDDKPVGGATVVLAPGRGSQPFRPFQGCHDRSTWTVPIEGCRTGRIQDIRVGRCGIRSLARCRLPAQFRGKERDRDGGTERPAEDRTQGHRSRTTVIVRADLYTARARPSPTECASSRRAFRKRAAKTPSRLLQKFPAEQPFLCSSDPRAENATRCGRAP